MLSPNADSHCEFMAQYIFELIIGTTADSCRDMPTANSALPMLHSSPWAMQAGHQGQSSITGICSQLGDLQCSIPEFIPAGCGYNTEGIEHEQLKGLGSRLVAPTLQTTALNRCGIGTDYRCSARVAPGTRVMPYRREVVRSGSVSTSFQIAPINGRPTWGSRISVELVFTVKLLQSQDSADDVARKA